MKHLAVGIVAIAVCFGLMMLWFYAATKDDGSRIAHINSIFADRCVPVPPYDQARVVLYFEERGYAGSSQFQLAVRRSTGEEEAIFVPAEAILPLTPQPCSS